MRERLHNHQTRIFIFSIFKPLIPSQKTLTSSSMADSRGKRPASPSSFEEVSFAQRRRLNRYPSQCSFNSKSIFILCPFAALPPSWSYDRPSCPIHEASVSTLPPVAVAFEEATANKAAEESQAGSELVVMKTPPLMTSSLAMKTSRVFSDIL